MILSIFKEEIKWIGSIGRERFCHDLATDTFLDPYKVWKLLEGVDETMLCGLVGV